MGIATLPLLKSVIRVMSIFKPSSSSNNLPEFDCDASFNRLLCLNSISSASRPIDHIVTPVVELSQDINYNPDRTNSLKERCDAAYAKLIETTTTVHENNRELSRLKEEKKIRKKAGENVSQLTKEMAATKKHATSLKKVVKANTRILHDAYPVYVASRLFDQHNPHLKGRFAESDDPQFQLKRIPVYIDRSKGFVQCGLYECRYPKIEFLRESDFSLKLEVIEANGFKIPDFDYEIGSNTLELVGVIKHTNSFICNLLIGSKFNDYFRRANYYVWCSQDETRIKRFCKSRKYLIPQMVYRYSRFKSIIQKAIDNQEEQIIPAILFFGKNVPQLKEGLGNSLWKQIVKSSASRNALVFSRMMVLLNKYHLARRNYGVLIGKSKPRITRLIPADYKTILESLYLFPTTFLRMSFFYSYTNYRGDGQELTNIENYLKSGLWAISNGCYKSNALEELVNTNQIDVYHLQHKKSKTARITYLKDGLMTQLSTQFIDTRRMAANLDRPFNMNWSARRMHREHEILSRAGLKASVIDRPLRFKKEWPKNIIVGDVIAILLESTHSLIHEGAELKHCVGSYADVVDSGGAIIYSLSTQQGDQLFRSTLQLSVKGNSVFPVQNQSFYNEAPIQTLSKAAGDIAVEINKWLKR